MMFFTNKKIILSLFLSLSFLFPLVAELSTIEVPDSSVIRQNLISSWFTAPVSSLKAKSEELYTAQDGTVFQVRFEDGEKEVKIIVCPQIYVLPEENSVNSRQNLPVEQYNKNSFGSWILYREKSSGRPLKIKWHFAKDPNVYVQLRQDSEKTYADLIVYNSFAARSVPLGVSFARLYSVSFQHLYSLTRKTIAWDSVLPVLGQYEALIKTENLIREKLPFIVYTKNACYNEKGELYSIQTGKPLTPPFDPLATDKTLYLSGAGFVKWIVDGIVKHYTGEGVKIAELVEPTISFDELGKNGIISQNWDMTFTLDWVRNLAACALSVRSSHDYNYETGGVDVTRNLFSSTLQSDGKIIRSKGYVKNSGYTMQDIRGLLYMLAVTEPNYFYLAAIREPSVSKDDEIVFNNSLVIFPSFDDSGIFHCSIFEMGVEMSLDKFIERYSNCYVHLERVRAPEVFLPK